MLRTTDALIQLPRRRLFSALEIHAVTIGSIAAAVLLIGWGFGVEPIKRILPGFPTMKAVTAGTLMLLSMSCLTSLRGSRRGDIMAVILGGATVAVMAVALVIDPQGRWDDSWRQMPSEATMICLMAGGLAMLVVMLAPQRPLLAGALALGAASIALFRIFVLLLFRGAPLPAGSPLDTMALHTAILIVWFMTACVLMHPRLGFGEALFQSSLRGRVLRLALPFVVLIPVVAGAFSLTLSIALGWPDEGLFAMMAALSVAIGASLVWWLARLAADWQTESNEHAIALTRANEALEQYASSAAHDLKAPARHVLLYSELLDAALDKGDAEGARKYLKHVRDSASQLPLIIEGMLEYSRSGYKTLALREASLSELVQAAASLQEVDLKSADAHIIVAREARLWCDPTLMTAVFQNLIANSLKNRRKSRSPEIRIGVERQGDWDQVSVVDNGVGFDPDFAAVAFNPLARGVHLAGDGGGIGLATCRTIVQSHGGEIRVDPLHRGGARILFTLPLKPAG
jgi:signal transduction histidine kinase